MKCWILVRVSQYKTFPVYLRDYRENQESKLVGPVIFFDGCAFLAVDVSWDGLSPMTKL